MPIYEYQCEKCGEHLEVSQKISDGPLKSCPKCEGTLKKLISLSSFRLKGQGWYVTDYKKKPVEPSSSSSGTSVTPTTPKKEEKKSPPASEPKAKSSSGDKKP